MGAKLFGYTTVIPAIHDLIKYPQYDWTCILIISLWTLFTNNIHHQLNVWDIFASFTLKIYTYLPSLYHQLLIWLLMHHYPLLKQVNHIEGLRQERCNSNANALELCISCMNPSLPCYDMSCCVMACSILPYHIFYSILWYLIISIPLPDSKVHGANMGPTWVLSSPGGPHVGPMNLAIRAYTKFITTTGIVGYWIYTLCLLS